MTPHTNPAKLVPVEPTEAMVKAGSCGVFRHASTSGEAPDDAHLVQAKAAWAAMLAAAPDHVAQPQSVAVSGDTGRAALHRAIMNLPSKVPGGEDSDNECRDSWIAGYRMGHRDARHAAAALVLAAGAAPLAGQWVPAEPTPEMLRAGGHANSEWLNDNAPIGEARYAQPMPSVYRAMLAAAPGAVQPLEGHPQCHRCHGNSRTHRTDCPLFPEQEAVQPTGIDEQTGLVEALRYHFLRGERDGYIKPAVLAGTDTVIAKATLTLAPQDKPAAPVIPDLVQPIDERVPCPNCAYSEFPGFKRGLRCSTCDGRMNVAALSAVAVQPIEGVSAKNLRKAVPAEFWSLLHEWSESTNDERIDWIEHRFGELFALSKAVQPDPVQPIDERAAFEADLHKSRAEERGEWPSEAFEQNGDGRYVWQSMQHRWESWQARAAISAGVVKPIEGVSDTALMRVASHHCISSNGSMDTMLGRWSFDLRGLRAALSAGNAPALTAEAKIEVAAAALLRFEAEGGYLKHPAVPYAGTVNGDSAAKWAKRYAIARAGAVLAAVSEPAQGEQ